MALLLLQPICILVSCSLSCLFICPIIIPTLYNVRLNLHSRTCGAGSFHSGLLLGTHHHRAHFQETEQTTPVTLTPQVTSLEAELPHFSPPGKARSLSVCCSCSMVGIPQSRTSRLSLLHLHNTVGGFCIKVNCFSTV